MTFVIVLYVREGIVMASDSRLTMGRTIQQENRRIVQTAIGLSDSNYKTFLTPTNVGISTFGDAAIQGVPIAGYIDSFINEHLSQGDYQVDQIPQELLTYFRSMPGLPNTAFLVAGYKKAENISEQHVWQVKVQANTATRLNKPGTQGASWGGESDVLTRLLQPVGLRNEDGTFQALSHFQIQWGFFTLQDAIDYCIYAVKVTIDTMRFHPRPKTVGGPIDVLVIKPSEAVWVQRKQLRV
jgi:hypothetical protein